MQELTPVVGSKKQVMIDTVVVDGKKPKVLSSKEVVGR